MKETGKKEPRTLLGRAASFLSDLSDSAEQMRVISELYRDEARFGIEHGKWYRGFRSCIDVAMTISEELLGLQDRLDADPKFKIMHERVVAGWDKAEPTSSARAPEQDMQEPEPEWVRQSAPTAPAKSGDPARDQTSQKIHERLASQHQQFLSQTRELLRTRRGLRRHFDKTMRDMGLDAVLAEYFPHEESASDFS
ncbi:MAG: hypothetical protein H5U17_13600 [Defluviimonas sp.]|nr:hypothetical protein [Defluviimonas sp.]